MAKGVIYVMTTVVPGLIKIGKTRTDQFENRMYTLERNGYFNVVGLKRKFAIEVEDYDEKELLLDEIFAKSNVQGSELFALDADLVVQLLSSFEGRQVYPVAMTKEEVFTVVSEERNEERTDKENLALIPNGEYYIEQSIKGFGQVSGTMRVENGKFIVGKGSVCAPSQVEWNPEARRNAPISNNVLMEDVVAKSPTTAAWIVLGKRNNGWLMWRDKDGNLLDIYRKK